MIQKWIQRICTAGIICLMTVSGTLLPVCAVSASAPVSLRVGSFNINAVRQEYTPPMGLLLAREKVELAGIQEVKTYSGNDDNMKSFMGNYFTQSYFTKTSNYASGPSGYAVVGTLSFQDASYLPYVYNGRNAQIFQRVVVVKGGKEIAFYNTHLTWMNADARKEQIRQLTEAVRNDPVEYKVVVGDLNLATAEELNPLMEVTNPANGQNGQFQDTYNVETEGMTFYAIDHILVSRNIRINDFHVVETSLSDHNAIVADLTLMNDTPWTGEWMQHVLTEARGYLEQTDDYTSSSLKKLQKAVDLGQKYLEGKRPQTDLDMQTGAVLDAIAALEPLDAWRETDQGIMYKKDGEYLRDEWLRENGVLYYFDQEGYMKTGWLHLSGGSYYFDKNGALFTNGWKRIEDHWYYFDLNGKMRTGWLYQEDGYYYFGSDGQMYTGWLKLNGSWYYMQEDGKRAVGFLIIDGTGYVFDQDGKMIEENAGRGSGDDEIIGRPSASGKSPYEAMQESPAQFLGTPDGEIPSDHVIDEIWTGF